MYQAFQSGQISKITLHDVFVFSNILRDYQFIPLLWKFFFLMLISLPGQEGLNLLQATFTGCHLYEKKNTKPISFPFMSFKNCGSLK